MVKGVTETDVDLVNGALAGSERAFRELVQRYERSVFSVILRVVRDPSRAEELAQDTFVKAFLKLDTYAPERKFSSWLLAIAHHAAIDEVRRANVRTTPLEEAVHHLRPEYAEVIALRYEQDLTLEDVAEITGLPAGTVKSFLHRARKDLAEYLRRRGWSNKS